MAHTKILEMIENVSPNDIETLDEIDAEIQWLLGVCEFPIVLPISYTRSRDELKKIRPDGWVFWQPVDRRYRGENRGVCPLYDVYPWVFTKTLPTEELSELHAIIQAIAHERKENDHGDD